MNNIHKCLILSSLLFFVVSCGDPPKEVTLDSISLSGNYQKSFWQNETFNHDDLVVTAHFSDNTTSDVSSSATFSGFDMTKSGTQTVTVSYTYLNSTKTKTYQITVSEIEIDTYKGHMYFASNLYQLTIQLNDKNKYYLNPGVKDKNNKDIDVGDFPFTFEFDSSLVDVSKYGAISSKKAKTGVTTVTCIYTEDTSIKASCVVNIVETLPTKEKGWVRVDDYDSLSDKDILVMASPSEGVVASLDSSHSKLHPVKATFSKDYKTIISMEDEVAEFYLGLDIKGMTLEAQTGEYLICTHQGKVKLDSGNNTNKYWDIHSNVDPETGEGSLEDGAVIENNVESLGYMMFNITLAYFTTYVENSITQYMALPFIYRLQELN